MLSLPASVDFETVRKRICVRSSMEHHGCSGWPHVHAATNAFEFVESALSRKETERRLVLSARPEFAIQGHPRGQLVLLQGLRLSAHLRVIHILLKCRCRVLRIWILRGHDRSHKKRSK